MNSLSIKDAAIAAGCPLKTASQAGSRLEKHPNVIAYLGKLKQAESDKTEGAGRDAPPAGIENMFFEDPKDMLRNAMNDSKLDAKVRIQAAVALLPFEHQKMGETGKKEHKESAAQGVVKGRFAPAQPPQKQLSLVR